MEIEQVLLGLLLLVAATSHAIASTTVMPLQPYEQCGGLSGICSDAAAGFWCADGQWSGTACPATFPCQRLDRSQWKCLPGQMPQLNARLLQQVANSASAPDNATGGAAGNTTGAGTGGPNATTSGAGTAAGSPSDTPLAAGASTSDGGPPGGGPGTLATPAGGTGSSAEGDAAAAGGTATTGGGPPGTAGTSGNLATPVTGTAGTGCAAGGSMVRWIITLLATSAAAAAWGGAV